MNKWIKYGVLAFVVILLGYNSIYIEKLSDRDKKKDTGIDAAALAGRTWSESVPQLVAGAVAIDSLKALIEQHTQGVFDSYTHSLDIGNYRYALVRGRATVRQVGEDEIRILVGGPAPFKATLATEFVYGNTLRDALGLFALKDFPHTDDLNRISEALNKIVRDKVVPSFKNSLKPGSVIDFAGAVQLNKAHIHFDGIEIVPVNVKIVP